MASSSAPPEPLGIREDRWLSARLGRAVFTVADPGALGEHAASQTSAMYQVKVPVAEVERATALMAAGMAVVNVGVTLNRDPRSPVAPGEIEIREADPDADAAVTDIAERAFLYSRFHLDPSVPNDVAR